MIESILVTDTTRDAKLGLTLKENYRNIVREAMDAWEKVCGVTFREVADDPDNDIRIGWVTGLRLRRRRRNPGNGMALVEQRLVRQDPQGGDRV